MFFCISTVRFLVLINGEASGFCLCSRDLRQGDPISPLLFTLVLEAFSHLLVKAIEVGSLEGFHMGNSLSMSHLLFVDDTLIFYELDVSNLGCLTCILLVFEATSRLRVISKSQVVIGPLLLFQGRTYMDENV